MKRGDIYLTDFNPAKGGEIGKLRPAILLSHEEDAKALETVMVIPLSSVLEEDAAPYRLRIPARQKLKKESDACIYEIRALSKSRLKERLGSVTAEEYALLKSCLFKML